MPPPIQPFGGESTQRDAEILRQKLLAAKREAMEQLGIPQTSVIGDPAREDKLEASAEETAKITAELAVLTKVIPASIPRNILIFFAGVKKTPTGDTKIVPGTAGNFAPSPIGYLDPTTVGLKRNFYLPPGTTDFVPRRLDQLGFGLPEQRVDDERRALERDLLLSLSRNKTAAKAVVNESDETLQQLVSGQGGFTRAGVIRAGSGVPTGDLESAARDELALRMLARNASAPIGPDITPPADGPVRFAPADQAGADVNQEVQHLTDIDRLFAANPPDP